jgi:nucleoside-diphosphate-sugar epimerase
VTKQSIGLLGANSLVGECLLPLLIERDIQVYAFSRKPHESSADGVIWQDVSAPVSIGTGQLVTWLCAAPIWVLPNYFPLMEESGVRRIVALSSTSLFTKDDSSDPEERAVALKLADAEARIQTWAERCGVAWIVLRPTLIYGCGKDKNIAEIARFIHRFGFFPLFGKALGLRQPIHARDIAGVCVMALQMPGVKNCAYNISGGETLPYREMIFRVFEALGRPCRMLPVPLWAFRVAIKLLHCLPRSRHWSTAMAERMNRDLVFDHSDAANDLDFSPRLFQLTSEDLPI